MKIKLGRWYIALAVYVPGHQQPACAGFGLRGSEERARSVAIALATSLQETRDDART
jgi:hypothetical protein